MAPCLPLHTQHTSPRAPCLSNRHHSHGQAQTDLGPIDRLWGLCGGYRLYGRVRYWEEDATEAVLQADHETRSVEVIEHGGYDEEVGRRRDFEEGSQWDVAQK